MRKISVLIKEVGKVPKHVNISDSLESLQKTVGGYIETVFLARDMVVICNEEGRLRELPVNCNIRGIEFCGTVIIAGVDGEDFADLPLSWDNMKGMFGNLWE